MSCAVKTTPVTYLATIGEMVPGRVYVAGPMTNYPEFNFPAFDSLAAYMRRNGWQVINPAERDRQMYDDTAPGFAEGDVQLWSEAAGFDLHKAMRFDLGTITTAQAIVLLPGWAKSSGAQKEKAVAEAVGAEILYAFPVRNGDWFVSDVDIDAQVPEVVG